MCKNLRVHGSGTRVEHGSEITTLTRTRPHPRGWYLPEAAHPYYVLASHANIDFASLKGPHPPVDPESVTAYATDEECTKFLADETVKSKFATAKKLSEVSAKDYDMIFYDGGYAPVIDLPTDPDNINLKLATEATLQLYRSGKLVSAVCHGPTSALVGVTDVEGKNIFAGRPCTAFSNAEEVVQGKEKTIPFLPEDKLVSIRGVYSKAAELWASYVVVDGLLITGQNPGSAQATGEAILKVRNFTARNIRCSW
ncbi:ThiJ/PfpI [Mycena maculata]|uniref:D-lactate dehydratase n=1 Tax=Mycena maculata TaxID=230809 RepID=A0AAD7K3K7_9AGAR|nr:ThiJ/PfpI [Mycena maculata]